MGGKLEGLNLAECALRYRRLTEMVTVQVWTADFTGKFTFANPEALRFLGLPVGAPCPSGGWLERLAPEDAARVRAEWEKAVASGTAFEAVYRLCRHDHTARWFLGRAQALRGPAGMIDRWFVTLTDVERLHPQQTAPCTKEARDAFLAVLSHELRTPLTPAVAIIDSLVGDDITPPEIREQLSIVQRNLALTSRLIDDLFDVSGIQTGQFKLNKESCDAHELVDLALETVLPDSRARRCEVVRDYRASRHGVLVDPARFQQVLWNVLRNAIKFSRLQSRIEIVTRNVAKESDAGRPCIQIEITDSGIGLAPEMLEKIFQPYEQVGHAAVRHADGLGLGLAVARTILHAHDGTITARSKGLDQGAIFLIEVPCIDAPPRRAVPVQVLTVPAARQRILLVEDDASTLSVLQKLLSRDGHDVTTAMSVADAVLASQYRSFDLLISDLGLPDGSGIELMVQLGKTHGLRGIALTGYGMEADIAETRAAGFSAHLTKPIEMAALRRLIATASPA